MVALVVALGAHPASAGEVTEAKSANLRSVWSPELFTPSNISRTLTSSPIQPIAALSIHGGPIRMVVFNEDRSKPLVIGAAHVGVSVSIGAVVPGSDRTVSFGGHSSVAIPPRASIISDPVDLGEVPPKNLAITLFVPQKMPLPRFYREGAETGYVRRAGAFASSAYLKADSTITSAFFAKDAMVGTWNSSQVTGIAGASITTVLHQQQSEPSALRSSFLTPDERPKPPSSPPELEPFSLWTSYSPPKDRPKPPPPPPPPREAGNRGQ